MPRRVPPPAPTCFVPSCPADFVGQAGKVAELLLRKAERTPAQPDQPLRLLVSGAPGIGKTGLVNLIAGTLATHPAAIEEVSGLEVRLDLGREWTSSLAHNSLCGPWSVKVVNELDRCSKDAQDMLLAYHFLNRMKPGHPRARDPARQLGTNLGRLGSRTRRRAGLCATDAGHGIHLCRLQLSKREVVKTVVMHAELRCAEFILPR